MSTTPTVRELWAAADVLMGYWERLSNDREPVSDVEYVSRLAALPDSTRTDMDLIVLGFDSLRKALAGFDPDKWADEAKTQSVVAIYALAANTAVAKERQRIRAGIDVLRADALLAQIITLNRVLSLIGDD